MLRDNIENVAKLAKVKKALVVVDNVFEPILQKPLKFGADTYTQLQSTSMVMTCFRRGNT